MTQSNVANSSDNNSNNMIGTSNSKNGSCVASRSGVSSSNKIYTNNSNSSSNSNLALFPRVNSPREKFMDTEITFEQVVRNFGLHSSNTSYTVGADEWYCGQLHLLKLLRMKACEEEKELFESNGKIIGRYGWRTQTRTEELSQIYHFNLSVQSMTCNISLKSQENADSESSELNNKLTKSFKIIQNNPITCNLIYFFPFNKMN